MFYQKSILANGVTVISEHMEGVRSIALGFWVRVGSRDEDDATRGISHFMEHMLFKGTPTRSAADISIAFDGMGAELNAFTSREYTCFYSRMVDIRLDDAFEMLSDMLVNAEFAQEAMQLEREVVIEEIARSEDQPEDQVYDLLADAMNPEDALSVPVLGRREVVSGLAPADMHAYHDAHYTGSNLVIAASGNVDHEKLVALAQKWLAELPSESRLERKPVQQGTRKSLAVIKKDTEQAHILIGYPGLSYFAPRKERYAAGLLDTALGGGMSSRLFLEIRENRGLVYSVYTSSQAYEDCGIFSMYAGTRPENVGEVVEVALRELNRIKAEGIGAEELDRVREYVCGNFLLSMESTRMHMTRLGRLATIGTELRSVDEIVNSYKHVTADDVNAVAEKILSEEPTIAIVSPYSQEEVESMI